RPTRAARRRVARGARRRLALGDPARVPRRARRGAGRAVTRLPVALEITPPREPRPDLLLRRALLLGGLAQGVHAIQRPDRLPSREAALELERQGVSAVWHLVNRGRSAAELEHEIARAAEGGLRAALVVRGESGAPEREPPPKLAELVTRVRTAISG